MPIPATILRATSHPISTPNDGQEAAASPVMRVQSLAWRFDVPIPEGARFISLAAMDAGDGSIEDFADWANAGFVTK